MFFLEKKRKKRILFAPITSNFVYFSFLRCKRNGRVFQETSERGGCDSLPLVAASTSKQRESPLSYALHFLRIISHQMCCAGESGAQAAPCRNLPSSGRSDLGDSITTECHWEGCSHVYQQSQSQTVRGRKNDGENLPTARGVGGATLPQRFDLLFIHRGGRASRLPGIT